MPDLTIAPADLVDPELLPWLDVMTALSVASRPLADVRAMTFAQRDVVVTPAVQLTRRTVPGPHGAPDVPVHVYLPAECEGRVPCIVHMHGGGFVMGSPQTFEGAHRRLAEALGCAIVSVDYRLAPETRFPGALEDCYATLVWLFAHAAELRVDPGRIGVMGESAGGGLAAALTLLARDRGTYRLAFQHLTYPMLDDRTCARTDSHPFAGTLAWTAADDRFGWSALLGHEPGGADVPPYAAPARAADLSGLPPAYIAVGALDLFLEDDLDYARRLTRAGVPVELHIYPAAFHGFDLAPRAQVAAQARRDSLDALLRKVWRPLGEG